MVMALDGMVCSPAPQIVYSSAVLIPVSRIAPLRTVPRTRRRAVPEQEFPPPLRRSARSFRPDHDDEDPPPWADLPPVRPARSHRSQAGGNPAGPGRPGDPRGRAEAPGGGFSGRGAHAAPGGQDRADPREPVGSRRVSDPGQDDSAPREAPWSASWDGPEA